MISRPPLDLLKIATLMPRAEIRVDSQRPPFILENEIWCHISCALQVDSQTVDAMVHMLEESVSVSINSESGWGHGELAWRTCSGVPSKAGWLL